MSFDTIIAKTRQAIADDPAKGHVVFTAQGTLVGVTEVDIRTGAHSFKADEPPSIGGTGAAANPVQYALASLGPARRLRTGSGPRTSASHWTRLPCGSKATWICVASSVSTTGYGRAFRRFASR